MKNKLHKVLSKTSCILTTLIFLLLYSGLNAQTGKVSGTLIGKSDEPLPGVTITVKETQKTAVSESTGKFIIDASPGQTLLISSVGYESKEVAVGSQKDINIKLQETNTALSEVVVIGYGSQRRIDVTSAVATVKAENFVKGPVLDAGQLLQGKVAGLTIAAPSGNPTDGSQILLRGNTTLFGANANPLVIIDGIPGDLKTVAPEDIESVDVLKDGSSAAIYGVRGSNGVIIITTKRARGNVTNNVDYSGYVTTQVISKRLDMLTAQDYRDQIAAGTRNAN